MIYNGADMSNPQQIKSMVEDIVNKIGRIDVVVNNAGLQHVAPIEDFPEENYEKIIAVNLNSAFYTAKYSIPFMRENGWGRIINVASAHAKVASPFKSAYVAAKHGLAGLTKTIALEVGPHNITANAICPGYVLTKLVEEQIPLTAKAKGMTQEEVIQKIMLGNQPTGQFVGAEEIADLVAHLCSNNARSINGSIISVDGGWTAH